MIFDKIKNSTNYTGLNEKFKPAFEFLAQTDLKNIENGRYEINGDDVFVIIQDYQTKYLTEGKWEAHRQYIDIQYVILGQERLGYLPLDEFTTETEYNNEKDIVFGGGNGQFLTAKEGEFVIFMPQDAHMPGICINSPDYVKKAVVKVRAK